MAEAEKKCPQCHEDFLPENFTGDLCFWCEAKKRFGEFCAEYKLTRFVDPTGERYVYHANGKCAGKKTEEIDFMNELWNVFVRSQGREDLTV